MRICITRSEKYVYSETFIRDQIEGFKELTNVYTIHSGRYPERREDDTLLSPKAFWFMHKILKPLLGRNNFFSDYGVRKFFKENKIDVVLSNYGISASHMVAPCQALNIPLLVIFHGHDATDQKLVREYRTKYQKLFDYASFLIVVSEVMKNKLINLGAKAEKIRVIPCGVDPSKFKPGTRESDLKNFLAVGRFTAKKGPLYTIRAFNEVWKKFPNATLTMVGKKTGLYNQCEQLVAELGMQDSVNFTGILNQEQISQLMHNSLAFVQHSVIAPNGDMEGTPVSIMEASASGLPVISTRHGGINDVVIDGSTGYLVQETNVDEMAKHMIFMIENQSIAKEMGLKGREQISTNYHQQKQIQKIYNLAGEAVKAKN